MVDVAADVEAIRARVAVAAVVHTVAYGEPPAPRAAPPADTVADSRRSWAEAAKKIGAVVVVVVADDDAAVGYDVAVAETDDHE